MDNAFASGKFPGYTLEQLRGMQLNHDVLCEIERREAVAAGDVSKMTPGERLRAARR